ncbi:hypothetical protein HN011_004018 [Eciton burchellii]|nr:hypothetical protein HN011_004018 [Eciton burchellii]
MKSVNSYKTRKRLQQPPSSFADYMEEPTDEDIGKDFRTLMNAPLSKGGHFIFKSEKNWAIDSSQYSEFFTLNLKALSAAINCIPYNEYIDVNDKYFTNDQLISIYNNAEEGKAAYNTILDELNTSSSSNIIDSKPDVSENIMTDQSKNLEPMINIKSKENIDNLEEDIDFLLSLKEPVQSNITIIKQPVSISRNNDSKQKLKNIPNDNKLIDLEKWLDLVLYD